MSDFYLVSTEIKYPYVPRACLVVKRVSSEVYDKMALVELSDPLPPEVYNTENALKYLILAPRFENSSLFPVSEWPLSVYICAYPELSSMIFEKIDSEKLKILDYGEIKKHA